MAAIAGLAFFLAVLGFAGWVIAATLRPQLARIAELLQPTAPVAQARVVVRLPVRPAPVPFRQAA